jgi:hypothetical protein
MSIELLLEIAAFILAVSAVLLQPKRDPAAAPSWRNLSRAGRFLLSVIVVVALLNIAKTIRDDKARRAASDAQRAEVARLNANLTELRDTNRYLIKVMSVADGYNALVTGVATFKRPVGEYEIQKALENVFLKYAHVELVAINKLGRHTGRIDYGVQPVLHKFLRISTAATPELERLKRVGVRDRTKLEHAYYFEVRCSRLKILNDERVQYARFSNTDQLDARLDVFNYWEDYRRLYVVDQLYLDKITIEELGPIDISSSLWPGA